jgi:hypothetical protein
MSTTQSTTQSLFSKLGKGFIAVVNATADVILRSEIKDIERYLDRQSNLKLVSSSDTKTVYRRLCGGYTITIQQEED